MMSPEEALAFFIRLGWSQRSYQSVRNEMMKRNAVWLPPYRSLLGAKERCIPPGLKVEEGKGLVHVPIQQVLDHQLRRMFLNQEFKDKVLTYSGDPDATMSFWAKYGSDSATAQSQYMTSDTLNHQSVFSSYLVPVCLQVSWENKGVKKTLFINEFANSHFGCVILRMALEKENSGNYYSPYFHVIFQKSRNNLTSS